jgi:hypothetical protein
MQAKTDSAGKVSLGACSNGTQKNAQAAVARRIILYEVANYENIALQWLEQTGCGFFVPKLPKIK